MGNWITDSAEAVGGSAYDIFQSATGGETRAQQSVLQQQQAAKAASESSRKQLELQQRGLQVQGNDPASIQQHDNWEEWDHQRLVSELRDSLKVDDINSSGRAWEKLGTKISELFADLDKETRAAAGDGMRGQAAEAGLGAAKPLQEWGKSFGDSVRMTGLKVQEVGVTAEQTKQSIQPPSDPSTARVLLGAASTASTMGLGGLADAGLQMKEQSEDEKRARAVAQKVYTPGYSTVDKSTPTLPPPVDPLNPPPAPPPGSNQPSIPGSQNPSVSGRTPGRSGTPSGTDPSGSSPSGPGGPNSPSMPNSPAQSGSSWANPPHAPGAQPPGAGGPPGGPGGAPGGMVGGAMPGSGAGAGGGAGAGRGAGGAGVGAGGRPASGMGAGGRAGAGGAAGGGAGAAGASGSGAGGRGAGGAAGGGAGGGRGQDQDYSEHERPSWLEEQDDIWLEDMPKTAPAVFGDWGR